MKRFISVILIIVFTAVLSAGYADLYTGDVDVVSVDETADDAYDDESDTEVGVQNENEENVSAGGNENTGMTEQPEDTASPADSGSEQETEEISADRDEGSDTGEAMPSDDEETIAGDDGEPSIEPETGEEGASGEQGQTGEEPEEDTGSGEDSEEGSEPGADEGSEEGTDSGEGEDTPEQDDPIPDDHDAYILDDEGNRLGGPVEELLALETDTAKVIYISTDEMLTAATDARAFTGVEFEPDPEMFDKNAYTAVISLDSIPADAVPDDVNVFDAAAYCSGAEEDEELPVTVYIRVLEIPIDPPEEEDIAIHVSSEGLRPGVWSNGDVSFGLSGIPDGRSDLTYAVIFYDEKIEELDTDLFVYGDEGITALRFAIMDDYGDMLSVTSLYTLYLDKTAPALTAYVSAEKSYTLCIAASDELSDTLDVSFDGGETWTHIEENVYQDVLVGKKTVVYPAGSIMIRDAAGNTAENDNDIVCEEIKKQSYYWGSGTKQEHSKNETGNDGKAVYSGAELFCAEEGIDVFEIDDRSITFTVDGLGEMDETPLMHCAFAAWQPEEADADGVFGIDSLHTGELTEADDTLILTAVMTANEGEDAYTYKWTIDGYAMKKLANSGIKYIAFSDGSGMIAVPADGFTAGPDYTALKIIGTSSKKFIYTITMTSGEHVPDEDNITEDRLTGITVNVEDSEYTLLPAGEGMYAEDTYTAPLDALDYPYRAYPKGDIID